MNLRALQQFISVAEARSFRRAAELLHMAQPPLSVAIRRLEVELGGDLFSRRREGVELTALGRALLGDARQAVFHAQRVRDVARQSISGLAGVIRIGFVGSATYQLFPRALPIFRERFPQVQLDVRERTTTQILREVEGGQLDVGVIRQPVLEATTATVEAIEPDKLVVALPAGHLLAGRRKLRLHELAVEPFVMYSSSAASNLRGVVVAACQLAGFMPIVGQEAVQVQSVISFVESGLGIALVPSVCKHHSSSRIVFRELLPSIPIALALATRLEGVTPVVKHFRDVICAATAPRKRQPARR